MNVRIEKLAEQAGATVITTHGMEHVVDGCYVIGPARLEKFAELIVRECLKNIETAAYHDSCEDWEYGYNSGLNKAKELIVSHFEVEE